MVGIELVYRLSSSSQSSYLIQISYQGLAQLLGGCQGANEQTCVRGSLRQAEDAMPGCVALPPLPQQLVGTASHVYGEFALNSSSSWQTVLRVDELSVLRVHMVPIDVDVDATVLHARDGTVATSTREGVGHEELLLLPLAAANSYTLLLRFSGAQRSDCPALRIEASLTPARLLRRRLLELNAACPAEPTYPELDLAPLETHRPVPPRPVTLTLCPGCRG